MSNTKTWPDPDAANAATGPSVGAFYLLDPTTQKPVNPATSSSAPAADTVATGTLTAAQATAGTPVVGGTVSITLGAGQATVEAALTGTFNAGTTILFEGTEDSGVTTNWFSMFGLDTSVQNPTNISSIAGGASKLVRIPSMGYSQVRLRATPFAGGDSVSVRLVASVAGSGGSGGAVTVTNANANGQATMVNSSPVVIASDQTAIPVSPAKAGYIALTSPPANTNAGSDTALTFSSQVNHFGIQNNTSSNAYIHYESAASTASLLLMPGGYQREDKLLTVLHVFTAAAQPINAANGLVVEGWL